VSSLDSLQLTVVEQRVLGALIEKERTTPETYPLSLNALTNACNQKSNRNPVMALSEQEVVVAVDRLRLAGLVMKSLTSGSRVEKYKQTVAEKLDLLQDETAVLCGLLLRGAQTPGELRTRSQRFNAFNSVDEVVTVLHSLAGRQAPMVEELPRQPGQKEQRWVTLLGDVAELDGPQSLQDTTAARPVEDNDKLREEVEALSARVQKLEEAFDVFRRQFE